MQCNRGFYQEIKQRLDFLLDHGARPEQQLTDNFHNTPLHLAIANASFSDKEDFYFAKVMIHVYAEGNVSTGIFVILMGEMYFCFACMGASSVITELLTMNRQSNFTALDINAQDNHGFSAALHHGYGRPSSYGKMIKQGADPLKRSIPNGPL